MHLVINNTYHLSGTHFGQATLKENNNMFRLVETSSTFDSQTLVFEGVITGDMQLAGIEARESGTAIIKEVTKKPKQAKRKKGSRRKEPTVNKATILFMSGETYTVKDFVSIEATGESVVFIMEDNWKGTVNSLQVVIVPNHDVAEVKVRGVKHQFVLEMGLTNMGQVVFQADGVEMFTSSISIAV